MAKLYQFGEPGNKAFSTFLEKLVHTVGELPAHVEKALRPLDRLPVEWHARAAQMAAKSVRRHGVAHLPTRFSKAIEILVWLEKFGLHLRPTKGQVQRVAIETETPSAQVAREVGRLAEMVGQELLIHCLEGNQKVTTLGRKNLVLADQFTLEGLHNTHRAVSRKSLNSANERREAARCADFRNRADGLAQWAAEEGFFGVKHYITPPACFSPGPYSGDVDERWIAAGKPSPRQAADWLFAVLNATRARAAAAGIVPIGIRVIECFESGVPHINLPSWFKSKSEGERFRTILNETYWQAAKALPEAARAIRSFGIDQQAIVCLAIQPGLDEAQAAVSYAYKYVQPSVAGSAVLPADDRAWCKLWSIRQFSTWGAPSAASYRALARPSAQTRAEAQAGLFPAPLAALMTATTSHDYAAWLRMTHPLSKHRTVLAGPNTLVVINHSAWTINQSKGGIFHAKEASLQLCEAYPTTHSSPPPTPPPRPAPDPQNTYLRESRS